MKLIALVQILSLGSVLAQEHAPTGQEKTAHQATLEAEKAVWNSIGKFGFKLSQKLISTHPHDNLVYSPLSIATALSMALTGAGGSTKQEMLQAMDLQGIPSEFIATGFSSVFSRHQENATAPATAPGAPVRNFPSERDVFALLGANRLYVNSEFPIKDDYKAAVERNFHAEALNVDFLTDASKVKTEINRFVEERTKGLIKEILQKPLSAGTLMAIINTLYFKGFWMKRMSDINTPTPTVFNAGCADLQSELSKRLGLISSLRYLDSEVLQAQMVLLPYVSESFVAEMLIVLPRTQHACKTPAWINQISWDTIKTEIKKMQMTKVDLDMPEFNVSSRYYLEQVLPALGMSLAFSDKANFTGISDHKLSLDRVIHQVEMIVNKYGTEAAAATATSFTRSHDESEDEPVLFNVNRSFYLSLLYHENNDYSYPLPLFSGVVNRV